VKLYLLCGLAFSGKSTLAAAISRELDAVVVSLDEINSSRGLQGGLGIPDAEWARTHEEALRRVESSLRAGRDTVVDDTNCFRFLRDAYRAVADRFGAATIVIHLDVPVNLALERLRANERSRSRAPVTESILLDLARKFERPAPDETVLVFPESADPAAWVSRNLSASAGLEATFKILGQRLEYRWIGPGPGEAPTIVFLHEGLGSAGMWRDFPERLAEATGCGALVYSRRGYGASDPVAGPRPVRFMHDEALHVLPAVLRRFALDEVVLFGHSDGASIALVCAGARREGVRALVLEAPHVFVEPVCVESIARIAAESERTGLRERLARHHGRNTDSMFRTWTDVWLRPEFRRWNIEEYLPAIEAPVLVIQGEDDEYGTVRQVDAVLAGVSGPAESLLLRCGHSPHRDRPDEVLEAAARFIRRALARPAG
jgi:pimeloyl-ACP methyl ester carboxylesterase/predicted kinase